MIPFVHERRETPCHYPAKHAHIEHQFIRNKCEYIWRRGQNLLQDDMRNDGSQCCDRIAGQADRYAHGKNERQLLEDRIAARQQIWRDVLVHEAADRSAKMKLIDIIDGAEAQQDGCCRQCCDRQHEGTANFLQKPSIEGILL